MPRSRIALSLTAVGVLVMLSSCAAGPNALADGAGAAGFWLGLWQGLIIPITFIISLFSNQVSIYEVNNNGGWYDFGFMLGICAVFSGGPGAGGSHRARRRRRREDATL
ncbi:MAG TPA: hypothetical protein VLJ88_08795 [Propionibacteriaceae bacterium]|nr:hypothetical protein [Propionibacteriaceae bacterium]